MGVLFTNQAPRWRHGAAQTARQEEQRVGTIDVVPAGDQAHPRAVARRARVSGAATGRALIAVDAAGGNTVTTSKGANARLDDAHVDRHGKMIGDAAVVLVQLGVRHSGGAITLDNRAPLADVRHAIMSPLPTLAPPATQ